MPLLDRLTNRLLSLLGLDMDFSIDLQGDAFSAVTTNLFVGSRPSREDIRTLKEAGITHVVSCLEETERSQMAHLRKDFRALFLAVRDGIDQDIAATFPEFFEFAAGARDDHPRAKLLVHCEAGVSRSATLATALLMKSEGKRFIDAIVEVRAKRPGVLPNIGFASQLQRLEHSVAEVQSDDALSSLARYLHEVCKVPADIEVLEQVLEQQHYDAPRALRAIFGDEIPRVVQGVRL